MADEIQGLAVKASITDDLFTQGVSKINKAMSLLQSEFKASSEGLKGFGTNVDQLGNKSEYLNKAIELQQQKVKALQEAYAKSKTETGEFSNSTMAAGTKVNNAVAALAKLQNELKQVDEALEKEKKQVDEEGNIWDKFSVKLKSATSGMGEYIKRGIGLAIGGDIWDKAKEGFSTIINFGGDAQKALNGITAATGLTGESINGMRQIMTDIYNDNFGENFEDIAESITAVGQQTGATGEDLKGLTEKALLMRDTFGMEVNESIRSVTMLMKQFGITGDEAFNLIAQGKQKGLDFSDEMIDSVDEYSVQFKKLGLDAQDMFNVFASGAQSGAFNLDKVGDSVKEFSIRAVDGSKTTQDGFTQLGFNADELAGKFAQGGDVAKGAFEDVVSALGNMDDPLKQSQVGVELFGTQFEDLGINAITSLENLNGGISQTTDVLTSMNNVKYNDLGTAFEGIKRNIQTALLLPMSNEVLPSLSDFSNWFTSNLPSIQEKFSGIAQVLMDVGNKISEIVKPVFEELFNFIGEHGEATTNIILGIGGAFLTFSTVKGTIEGITGAMKLWDDAMKIKESISGIVEVMKGWEIATKLQAIAQGALNVVMDANPIAIIVIAIGALVAGIVLAYNKCEWFRNGVNAIGEWLKNFFTVTLPQAFNTVVTFFQDNWKEILLFIVNPFAGAFALLYNNCDGFREKIDTFITAVKIAFTNGWNAIVSFFTITIPQWINNLGQWFAELPNKIMYGLGSLVGMLATWGVEVWNYFSTNVPIWINNVTTFFSQLPTNIWNFLTDIVAKIGQWGSNVLNYITTNVPIWINNTVNFFAQLPSEIWNWLVNVVTDLGTWGSNVISWISTNVSIWITNIVNYFTQLPSQIGAWLTNVVTDLGTWGSNMYNTAQTEVSTVVDGIIQWFSDLPNKMIDIGSNIVGGIKQGISNGWDNLKSWVGGLCDSFVQGVKDKFEIHSPSHIFRDQVGAMLAQGIGVGFENEMPTINTNIGKTIDGTIQIANLSSLSSLKNIDKTYSSNNSKDSQPIILYTTNVNQVDSKEVSRTTTKQVLNNLNRESKNNNIALGRSGLAYGV